MAFNAQFSNEAINAEADALSALLDNGYIRIYDGVQPLTAEDAITDQTLLAELRFAADAFPAAVEGVLTSNAISDEDSALAAGTASWCRLLKADGTSVVVDGTVGESNANLLINSIEVVLGAVVSAVGPLIIAVPKGGVVIAEDAIEGP